MFFYRRGTFLLTCSLDFDNLKQTMLAIYEIIASQPCVLGAPMLAADGLIIEEVSAMSQVAGSGLGLIPYPCHTLVDQTIP